MKFLILCLLGSVTAAQAQLIVNGQMNTSAMVNVNSHNGVVPTGWTAVGTTTPDTFSLDTTFFSYTYETNPANTSPGYFTHISAVGSTYNEGIRQTVTGAVMGQAYALEFDMALDLAFSGIEGGGFKGSMQVTVAGNVFETPALDIPLAHGVAAPWIHRSFTFVAPSTSFTVQFRSLSDTAGQRIDQAIDNVTLTAIPEPSVSSCLALLGVLGLARRHRIQS